MAELWDVLDKDGNITGRLHFILSVIDNAIKEGAE